MRRDSCRIQINRNQCCFAPIRQSQFKGSISTSRERICIRVLQVVLISAIVFGAVKEADLVWMLGDIGVGLMAWVTVITILILCPKALDALKDYEQGLKIKEKIE